MGEARDAAPPVRDDGAPAPDDLSDVVGLGNLRVRCRSCWHSAIFEPQALIRWFQMNRYSTDLLAATRRFRCIFAKRRRRA